MCLAIDTQQPIVAEKDITVYKVLLGNDHKAESVYETFEYNIGQLYTTKFTYQKHQCYLDEKEVDDMAKAHGINEYPLKVEKGYIRFVAEGFHSALTEERLKQNAKDFGADIYECVIPKGALYYTNVSDLCVSTQIIIKNKKIPYDILRQQ